jgi:MFS family permease
MVVAFLFFVAAVVLSVVSLTALLMPSYDQESAQFLAYTLATFWARLPRFLLCGVGVFLSGAVGHGLMIGRTPARYVAIVLGAIAAAVSGWLVGGLLMSLYVEVPDLSSSQMVLLGLVDGVLGFATSLWIAVSLWRKRVREWFAFANEQRAEHFRRRRPARRFADSSNR